MMSKRVPLALVLSAARFVTSGFAATKKLQRNNASKSVPVSYLGNFWRVR